MAIKNHTDARSFSHDFLGKPAEPAAQPGR